MSRQLDVADDRCGALSRAAHEPMLATASRVHRWLLIEQPGPWGEDALHDSRLEPEIARQIERRADAAGVRVVMIRRPRRSAGASSTPSDRTVIMARTAPDRSWARRLTIADERELLALDLTPLDRDDPPAVGDDAEHVVLVCTNGRHDACCADHGRPVVRALAAEPALDEALWESSHVGGDRFAANVVHLPSGIYHGRVPPERAVEIVTDLIDGRVDLDHLRGCSAHQPFTQAAEVYLRRELDERAIDAIVLASFERVADEGAIVRLRHDDTVYRVALRRRRDVEQVMTCKLNTGQPWRYLLDDISVTN